MVTVGVEGAVEVAVAVAVEVGVGFDAVEVAVGVDVEMLDGSTIDGRTRVTSGEPQLSDGDVGLPRAAGEEAAAARDVSSSSGRETFVTSIHQRLEARKTDVVV